MTGTSPITHVIFDMDGVLLDTESFYTVASQELAARYGKVFDWALKSTIMGRPKEESAQIVVDALNLPIDAATYLKERQVRLEALFLETQPMPGAMQTTKALTRLGYTLAVATSSSSELFKMKTAKHQPWFEVFELVVTGDDPMIKVGKPAPDIFLLAAERLNVAPEQCLVFEDSPSGMQAALSAGMTVIGIADPRLDRALIPDVHHLVDSHLALNLDNRALFDTIKRKK